MEYGELLYGKCFHLNMKESVYKSKASNSAWK